MKNYIKLISLSLAFLPITVQAEETYPTCAELGYTDIYKECKNTGATALFCPFFNEKSAPYVLCLSDSCRGYPLTDADLNAQASDGKKVRQHIKELKSCKVNKLSTAQTYYRVESCESGSLFQNDICDVGCLNARYPYDSHQGDQAGDMRVCKDEFGEHFGYETCNEGWTGGWKTNNTGKCVLNTCKVEDFPYTSNPNAYYDRGATLSCRVGGNPYYRYTQVDKNGKALTENVCGLTNDYTLNNAVCSKECHFNNCTKTVKNETIKTTSFTYNDWSCHQVDIDCRLGDYAVIDGVNVGFITHFPDENNSHVNIIYPQILRGVWDNGTRWDVDTPINSSPYNTTDGKYVCNFDLAQENMEGLDGNGRACHNYEALKTLKNFAPDGCGDGSACGKGEWYVPSQQEILNIYRNKYILYNTTKSTLKTQLYSDVCHFSSPGSGRLLRYINFSGQGSLFANNYKTDNGTYLRMLSFTLK